MDDFSAFFKNNYKTAASDESLTNRRYEHIIKRVDEDLPIIMAGNEEIQPIEDIYQLEEFINRSNREYTNNELQQAIDLVSQIPIKFISKENIESLLNRLPPLNHIETSTNSFRLLSLIIRSQDNAKEISARQLLNRTKFDFFTNFSEELQVYISSTIGYLVYFVESELGYYYNSFFPYFLQYFTGNTTYSCFSLSEILLTASRFISLMNNEELEKCFRVFSLYLHRNALEDIYMSLNGIIRIMHQDFTFVAQLVRPDILDRLISLGYQKRYDLADNEPDPLKPKIIIVFQYLLADTSVSMEEEFYQGLSELIVVFLSSNDQKTVLETLMLVGFAVHNPFFIKYASFLSISEYFFNCFHLLKYENKKEWASALANVYYFLPIQEVESFFAQKEHIEKLVIVLELADDEVIDRVVKGLYHTLSLSEKCVAILKSNNEIIPLLESIESENTSITPLISKVLKLLR